MRGRQPSFYFGSIELAMTYIFELQILSGNKKDISHICAEPEYEHSVGNRALKFTLKIIEKNFPNDSK